MVKIGRKKNPTQYLSFCRFRQMANVGGKGLLYVFSAVKVKLVDSLI